MKNRSVGSTYKLRLPALEIRQGPNRLLYSFCVDGKLLSSFTTVTRLRRDAGDKLLGYQRPEVQSHIAEIRRYLSTDDPMIPNALVVAFDHRVRFEARDDDQPELHYCRVGSIVIPVDEGEEEVKYPGWIVDGQQRAAAIRQSELDEFPIGVIAFITDDSRQQREQFILVNSTKPLPKGLIYELLPETDGRLSSALERRRFPAYLLSRLNRDSDSPLRGMIRTPTATAGVIQDNSVLRMAENSLTDGVLYRFRDGHMNEDTAEPMLDVLKAFWTAAAETFPNAWGLPPRRSRLMHGAGIVSMGFLMDAIADRHRSAGIPDSDCFQGDLASISGVCRWTDGYWDFGPGAQRKWNEIQNTSKDVQFLSNYLLTQYRLLVWSKKSTVEV